MVIYNSYFEPKDFMTRKKWSKKYIDLRGRWMDAPRIIDIIISDAKKGKDWTVNLKEFMAKDSKTTIQNINKYQRPPDLRRIVFDDRDIKDCQFPYADLSNTTAYRAVADNINCIDSLIIDSKWRKCSLVQSKFQNSKADFSYWGRSDLSHANYKGASLKYASFHRAKLSHTNLSYCDLRFSNLSEVNCEGADFSYSKLFGASLWNVEYHKIKCQNIDISPKGDGSILIGSLRSAPLFSLLTELPRLAEIIAVLKLNTIAILGADSSPEFLEKLNIISSVATKKGLIPIIIKKQAEIHGETFLRKALMYSLLAKYVIIDNSHPSGHIDEFSRLLDSHCIIGVLQKEGTGGSWISEEDFLVYPNTLQRFFYKSDTLIDKTKSAIEWCEKQSKVMAQAYENAYSKLNLNYISMDATAFDNDME